MTSHADPRPRFGGKPLSIRNHDFGDITDDLEDLCGHNDLPGPSVVVSSNCPELADAWFTGHHAGLRIAPELADPELRDETRMWFLARALGRLHLGRPPWWHQVIAAVRSSAATLILGIPLILWATGNASVWSMILGTVAAITFVFTASLILRNHEARVDQTAAELVAGVPWSEPLDPITARELDEDTSIPCWHPWRTQPSPNQRLQRHGRPETSTTGQEERS